MEKAATFGDAILGGICPSDKKDNKLRRFELNLGCSFIYIIARLISSEPIKYNILYFDFYAEANNKALEKCIAMFNKMVEEDDTIN